MPKPETPTAISDFTVLPVIFQSKVFKKDVRHYIYLKAYEPKTPSEESSRAIFLVNIPVTSTEAQLRHLLTNQLKGSHVQHIHFAGQDGSAPGSSSALIATLPNTTKEPHTALGKRKRPASSQESSEDIAQRLSAINLPSTHPIQLHATGSTAIATFLDRASRDLTLRQCRKAAKSSTLLIWNQGLSASKLPPLGVQRYAAQRTLTFPPRAELLTLVDEYMSTYAELEAARGRESAKKRAEPDEDGFVTVTRGSKGVVKAGELDAIKARVEEKKRKRGGDGGLQDFYRFQMRERRKEEQGKLVRQFEEEKRRVREMEERRGKVRPER